MELLDASVARPGVPDLTEPPVPFSGQQWLEMQARAHAHARFAPAAVAVLADLAQLLACERVSLGLIAGGKPELVAQSTGTDLDPALALNLALARAMAEACERRTTVIHPLPEGRGVASAAAHALLMKHNGDVPVCSVPLVAAAGEGDGAQPVTGVMLFERREGFDAHSLRLAKDAALFVGPLLELKHQVERPWQVRLRERLWQRGGARWGQEAAPWRLVALAAVLALLVAGLWPAQFVVVAPARLEGVIQRVLAAPADGYIASVEARPGDAVKAEQLLVTLQDRDSSLQRDRWAAESSQADRQYRDALTKDDAAQIVITRSKLEQAQAQLALAEHELERTRLRAPFDGVVIQGDLAQSIGAPVKRGQTLLTVAPGRALKVVIEVDEQDALLPAVGQKARVLFAADGQATQSFTIGRVSPVAVTLDGRNVFEVEGTLADNAQATQGLRPGQRGVARIELGRQMQARSWWLRLSNAWRRLAWRLLG